MPLRDRYLYAKDGLKRRWGMGSPTPSSTPVPSSRTLSPVPRLPTPSPSPAPDTFSITTASSKSSKIGSLNTLSSLVDSSTVKSVGRSGLKTLLKVVDSSAGLFPPLKSAIDGLSSCIEILENASKGRKDYVELLVKLDTLLGDLSGYIQNAAGSKLTASMMNLCIGLDQELKVVQEKNARGTIKRHLETLEDADDLMESYQRIQGYLERLTMNANTNMWETVGNLEMETRLKALMPTMAAVYNSAESEEVQRRFCTPGTRERELAKLLEWSRGKSSTANNVYWLSGMAGTGKTTIAATLCTELYKSAELGASFFCSRRIPECRKIGLIFPSIAYQLARFSRPFRHALSTILEAEPDAHTRALNLQFETLLVKPLSQVKHALPNNLVVVIDALDECEDEDRAGQMLDVLLSNALGSELPVRFLISSRPSSEISRRMVTQGSSDLNARLVLHNLDAQMVKHDIEVYLRAELTAVDLTSSQLSALVELSGILFIFASTAARYIREGLRYMEHEERLNAILELSSEPPDGKDKEIERLCVCIFLLAFQNELTILYMQQAGGVEWLANSLEQRIGQDMSAWGRYSSTSNLNEQTGSHDPRRIPNCMPAPLLEELPDI